MPFNPIVGHFLPTATNNLFFVLGRPYVRISVTSHATIHLQMACAPEPTSHYTEDSLHLAIQDVRCSKLSLRKAALQYGIPKSTLSLYVSGKLQIGARRGPASILSAEEEQRIVDYAVHMGQIGYGRTREQIFDIVAAIVSKDGHPNPFVNGWPGHKWWALFTSGTLKSLYVHLRNYSWVEQSAVLLKF